MYWIGVQIVNKTFKMDPEEMKQMKTDCKPSRKYGNWSSSINYHLNFPLQNWIDKLLGVRALLELRRIPEKLNLTYKTSWNIQNLTKSSKKVQRHLCSGVVKKLEKNLKKIKKLETPKMWESRQ